MTNAPVQAPASIAQVVQRMREIDRESDPHDGVACFNRMHLRVTELVEQNLVNGFFEDPSFLERTDVLVAERYFEAVDAARAGHRPPGPWKPLFDARGDRTVWPVQFALAGMNAHINHDLALAVNAACRERGTTPHTEPVHADYLRINELLGAVEAEIRAEYEPLLLKLTTARAEQLKHVLSAFSTSRSRDAAWGLVLTLWEQRDVEVLHKATLATVSHSVASASTALLTPVVPPPA